MFQQRFPLNHIPVLHGKTGTLKASFAKQNEQVTPKQVLQSKTNNLNKKSCPFASMSRHTFFTDYPCAAGDCAELSKEQRHHLFKVFRASAGDEVELLDGKGMRAFGTVTAEKDIRITSVEHEIRKGGELHLVFALPRKNQLDLLLKQAAEQGVAELHPVRFERSVSQAECKERWTTILEEACKQSKNPFLPKVNQVCSLPEKLSELKQRGIPIVFGAIRSESDNLQLKNSAAWVVGPEGGFTSEEEQLMRDNGASPFNLGPWVLRLETAACAGIAVLRQFVGALLIALFLAGCAPEAVKDPFFKKAERARNSGNYQSALSFYRRALYRHPNEPEIYIKIASLCDESLDDPVAALFYYDEYLKMVPVESANAESIKKLRDLVEQRLLRRAMKNMPVSPELEKLRRDNAYLLKMNHALSNALKAQRQTQIQKTEQSKPQNKKQIVKKSKRKKSAAKKR